MWSAAAHRHCARAGASLAARTSSTTSTQTARPLLPRCPARTWPRGSVGAQGHAVVSHFRPFNMAGSDSKASGSRETDGVFSGSSAAELEAWLLRHGLDTSAYGVGPAKSMAQLFEEIQLGESQLKVVDGELMRIVSVLNVFIGNSSGQVLMEEHQVRPCGTVRARGLPLSEKLKGGEDWQPAVLRAVMEELGSVLPPNPKIETLKHTYRMEVETKISNSYPHLHSVYYCHRVEAKVEGLPQTQRFVSTEPRPEGTLENHWIWQPA